MTSRMANLADLDGAPEFDAEKYEDGGIACAMPEAGAGQLVGRGEMMITAAYELLKEYGLAGLSIRAVLKRTGLNRRSFYERFSGKDDLVLAVFEQTLRLLAAQCRDQVKAMPDPLDRLKFIVTFIVFGSQTDGTAPTSDIRRNAALCREHMRLAESRPNDLRIALRPLIALLSEQLATGIKNGQVRDSPPERLATLVYNLVSTTVHAEMLAREAGEPERIGRTQLADDIWEFCGRGIAA